MFGYRETSCCESSQALSNGKGAKVFPCKTERNGLDTPIRKRKLGYNEIPLII